MSGPLSAVSPGDIWQLSRCQGKVPKNGDSVTIGPTSSQLTPHVTGMPGGTQLQDLALSNASLSGGDVTAMSRRTVEFHLSNAYQKLGVRSRGDLVPLALS